MQRMISLLIAILLAIGSTPSLAADAGDRPAAPSCHDTQPAHPDKTADTHSQHVCPGCMTPLPRSFDIGRAIAADMQPEMTGIVALTGADLILDPPPPRS